MTPHALASITVAHLDELVAAGKYHLQQLERQGGYFKTVPGMLPPSQKEAFNYYAEMTEGSAQRLRDALSAIEVAK